MKRWFLIGSLISIQLNAASISTYRIYLDSDNRQQKFIIHNRSSVAEKCDISFSYMGYTENAEPLRLTKDEQEVMSKPALERLRYSPRQFIIEPKSFQYVAFNYRRQINDVPAEFRTYANIKCLKIQEQNAEGITLSPVIMHSVPLVIRTGPPQNLQANLIFSQVVETTKQITFRIQHQGERSVYGDLHVVDGQGEKLKVLQRNIVIYPEMQYKEFTFSLPEDIDDNSQIQFEETGRYKYNQTFILPLKGAEK